ncbi:MAG: class I SAM-dependent methyltransferase [Elusimicrobia bacterium]|nr:class I SAM-dependent methyltransferase [Elusimicrobiota bacterium]
MREVEVRERQFWDARAQALSRDIRYYGDLVNTNDTKLIALHRYALGLLGDIRGKRILDYGCGYGALSCHLAKRGAEVSAVDISEESLAVSREWFRRNGVEDRVELRRASAHELPYEDGAFDFVVGSCILHHLDARHSGLELARVLKPGGKAVFVENNAGNPLLMFFRDRVLSPLKLRRGSEDESPLDDERLRILTGAFAQVKRHYPEMICLRLAGSFLLKDFGPARRALQSLDDLMLKSAPSTAPWSYFQVVELVKEAA